MPQRAASGPEKKYKTFSKLIANVNDLSKFLKELIKGTQG